jgi:hypothetical protein
VKRSETVKGGIQEGKSRSAIFFNQVLGWFNQPIPIWEIIALRRYAKAGPQRDAIKRSATSFVVRNVATLLLLGGVVWVFMLWQRTDRMQVRLAMSEISDADVLRDGIEPQERQRWFLALLANHEWERVNSLLVGVKSRGSRSEMAAHAAASLAAIGQMDDAFEFFARSLTDAQEWDEAHEKAIVAICKRLVTESDARRLKGLLTTAQTEFPALSARVALHAARTLGGTNVPLRDESLATALKTSDEKSIPDARTRFDVLSEMIELHRQYERRDEVDDLLAQALQVARSEGNANLANLLLVKYAVLAADGDDWVGSRNAFVEALGQPVDALSGSYADAYKSLGIAWAVARRSQALIEDAGKCAQWGCSYWLGSLALGLLGAGDAEGAFALIEQSAAAQSVTDDFMEGKWWDRAVVQAEKVSCSFLQQKVLPKRAASQPSRRPQAFDRTFDPAAVKALVRCGEYTLAVGMVMQFDTGTMAAPWSEYRTAALAEIAQSGGSEIVRSQVKRLRTGEQCLLQVTLLELWDTPADDLIKQCAAALTPETSLSSFGKTFDPETFAQLCLERPRPQADECAKVVEPADTRMNVLRYMAESYAKEGKLSDAMAVVTLITDSAQSSSAHRAVQVT